MNRIIMRIHYPTVKVVPHAGGVGLCEMVHHLQMWDYTSLSTSKEDRYVEYVDQQHEQFINPVVVKNAHYIALTVGQCVVVNVNLLEFKYFVKKF